MTMNIDNEFMDKLHEYTEIKHNDIRKNDHLRVTSAVYKEPEKRKCSYIIIKGIVEGNFVCNSYKPIYKDWVIKPDNKWKRYRFYKKNEREWDGICLDCKGAVDASFFICLECKMIRKENETK